MAPIDFPFAHDDVVQKIVGDVQRLSAGSLAADQGVRDIHRSSTTLAEKYKDDITQGPRDNPGLRDQCITALAGLSPRVEEFAKSFNDLLWAARKSATLGASRISDFVDVIVIGIVEDIKTPEDRDEAIIELKAFTAQKSVPVEGFPGATKQFGDIWANSSSDAANIQKVLEDATDIKKTVQELTKAFSPAKAGYKKVQDTLRAYASEI